MGRELPSRKGVFHFYSGKGASKLERSFLVGRELPSGREFSRGKAASQWEERFTV